MDSALSSSGVDHHRCQRARPPPSSSSPPLVDVPPPPPPRQPLRRRDTDGGPPRPSPPPPLPAREPLRPRGGGGHAVVEAAAPPGGRVPTALDSVVPLLHWPLRDKPAPPEAMTSQRAPVANGLPVNVMMAPSVVHRASPPLPAAAVVTQPAPNPCGPGRGNLYVDSPTTGNSRSAAPQTTAERPARTPDGGGRGGAPVHGRPAAASTVKLAPAVQTAAEKPPPPAESVTSPAAGGEKPAAVVAGQPRSSGEAARVCRGGVTCPECGRCRCANCRAPRELPRRWIGDCECSVQRCVKVRTRSV